MRASRSIDQLRKLDPVDPQAVDVLATRSEFDELFELITETDETRPADGDAASAPIRVGPRPEQTRRNRYLLGTAAAVVLLGAVLSIGFAGGSRTKGPAVTPSVASRALPHQIYSTSPSTTWKLVSNLVSLGWNQSTSGPPPGTLTCPMVSACYGLAPKYASPKGNAPLLSVSLYVSSDFGLTWSVLPVPSGVDPTTPLACGDAQSCFLGGTLNRKPLLLATGDGGHQWTLIPLHLGGTLIRLSCPSATSCSGIIANPPNRARYGGLPAPPGKEPHESFVSTADAGQHWTSHKLSGEDGVAAMSCAATSRCLLISGQEPIARGADGPRLSSVAMLTVDGGKRWTLGQLPAQLEIYPTGAGLSCVDGGACLVLGLQSVPNQDKCSGPFDTPPPGSNGCSTASANLVTGVATTANFGLTWQMRPLPSDVPQPELTNVACATASTCWLTGSEAVPEQIGQTSDGGSSVILGTADSGATWTKVTFEVPPGAPNYYGQSYLSIGSISCPTANACIALGVTAQGAKSAPVYRYTSPPSA